MEEQARDAFFDDLRSLARTVEKGRRDLQTALDSDAESTEQLDNLRSVFTGAKSLKEKCVEDLSAANSAHAEHTQALAACQKTLERCRHGLTEAVTFLEKYGYVKESASQPSVDLPASVACPTSSSPTISDSSLESTFADGNTPTLERIGISAQTRANLRRGQQAMNPPQSALPGHIQSAMPRQTARTPNENDLDRTLAELSIESVSVLGPMQRTGVPLTSVRRNPVLSTQQQAHTFTSAAAAENTMYALGQQSLNDPLQTPLAFPSHAGYIPASAFTNQSHQSYHRSRFTEHGGIPFAMEQPTPAMYAPAAGQQDITHTLTSVHDGMPDRTVATMATPHFAGGEIDQETPRPSVQSSTAAAFPLFANPVTPSAASAFNLVSQMPSVVQQQPIHTAPRAASAFSSSSALSDQTVLDIPVPDVQTVKLLPPGYGGGSTGVSDSTSLTSSTSNSTANTSTVIMPANHDAHNGPAPPGSVIGAPRMQLVSEDEYCSTPQYLRFQLTFEVFNEILSAVNLIAQSPRGDLPAGRFTLPELRTIPAVGARSQVIYLLLLKLNRIRVLADFAEQTYEIL